MKARLAGLEKQSISQSSHKEESISTPIYLFRNSLSESDDRYIEKSSGPDIAIAFTVKHCITSRRLVTLGGAVKLDIR